MRFEATSWPDSFPAVSSMTNYFISFQYRHIRLLLRFRHKKRRGSDIFVCGYPWKVFHAPLISTQFQLYFNSIQCSTVVLEFTVCYSGPHDSLSLWRSTLQTLWPFRESLLIESLRALLCQLRAVCINCMIVQRSPSYHTLLRSL